MSNRRRIFGLAAIFIILIIIVMLQSRTPSNETIPDTSTPNIILQRVYPQLAVLDIAAIRLENPTNNTQFTMRRDVDGRWNAVENIVTLQSEQATNIGQTFVLLPYQKTITIDEQTDLSEYGFDTTPSLLITALIKDGSSHIVAVGSLTPTSRHYYALVDEIDAVYLLERGPIEFLLNQIEMLQET